MNNENNRTTIEDNAKINALNNSGDNIASIEAAKNNNNISDMPITNTRKYNVQNLKPYNKTDRILTKEEAKRRGSKGGKKSGEVRKARKTMKESILELLAQPMTEDLLKQYGLDNVVIKDGATFQDGILAAALLGAMNGDIKAAQYLRDTAGEQPALHTVNQTEIVTKEDLKTIDNLKQYLTG